MKLSELQLPPSVISVLYSKTLVETGDIERSQLRAKTVEDKTPEHPQPVAGNQIAFFGENKKNILVAVNYSDSRYLPDDDLSFLTNMLTACKLGIADIAIINLHNVTDPSYRTIFDTLRSSIILLFGMEPSALSLPVSFPQFQVQSFSSYTFLSAPALTEIQQDKILKSKLWVCLRRIFNV